jgi:hypothetical protein
VLPAPERAPTRTTSQRGRYAGRPCAAIPHAEAGFGPPVPARRGPLPHLRRTASLPHSTGATRRARTGRAALTAPPGLCRCRRTMAMPLPIPRPAALERKGTPSPPPCSPLNVGWSTPARTAPWPGRCRRTMAKPHGELHLPVPAIANQSCYYLP